MAKTSIRIITYENVNFSIRFKQAMGCSPQAYRKEYAEIVKN